MTAFAEVVSRRHDYSRRWKERTGGKVIGYLCTYVPEELIYAAGALPVRLLGGHQPQDVTGRHIFDMFCAYCRDVLSQGLLGKYDYVDGIVFAHCCPHIRQTFESWRRHLPVRFSHLLWVPSRVETPYALDFYLSQVEEFKHALEKWLGTPISERELAGAVEVYNLNRRLLRRLYELRRSHPPRVSGTTAMEIVLAAALMDKAEHNRLLSQFLEQPQDRALQGVRLMVLGSENDDVNIIRLIESLGSVVVIEDDCTGNRYFWNETTGGDALLRDIAARYLGKPPCPLRDIGPRRRPGYLLELAREYQVRGAVFLRQKFCDPHAWEIPVLQRLFQEQGIPTLALELDATIPEGQYRTRVEAFLEMLM